MAIFVFLLHKLSDLCKKLPFVLPEWQEVARFFRGNQNKTSWRFNSALLEASTLTNSMFPIAKTFSQQKVHQNPSQIKRKNYATLERELIILRFQVRIIQQFDLLK